MFTVNFPHQQNLTERGAEIDMLNEGLDLLENTRLPLAPEPTWPTADPESEFPIQNLPYGVFTPEGCSEPRVGTRLGNTVIDLSVIDQLLPSSCRGCFGSRCAPTASTMVRPNCRRLSTYSE